MKLVVRCAEKKDILDIIKLYDKNNYYPDKCFCRKNIDTFDRIVSSENQHIILCEIDSKVVACCRFSIMESIAYECSCFCVANEFCVDKNKNILLAVSLIVSKVKELSYKNGCYKITIMNENKISFLNSLLLQSGFSSDGCYIYWFWKDVENCWKF